MSVVRVLPYLLAVLIIAAPLVFATAWDYFSYHYDEAWMAFGKGRVIDGALDLLQVLLLAALIVGVTLALVLVGRRLGAAAWRRSEGKPVLRAGLSSARFGLVIAAMVTLGVALFTWLPNGNGSTTDGHTLKESLEEGGSQATTASGADKKSARAGKGSKNPKSSKTDDSPEESAPDPQSGVSDTPAPRGSSSERAVETASPNSAAPASEGSTPVDTAAPPATSEEPDTTSTAPSATPELPTQEVPSKDESSPETPSDIPPPETSEDNAPSDSPPKDASSDPSEPSSS
jgi:hypothetical protein